MIRKTIAAAATAVALTFAAVGAARAQSGSAQQYLQTAQYYDSLAARYEAQGDQTTAARYRQAAQLYRQLAGQAGPTPQPPPTPQPQQPSVQEQIRQNAERSRVTALNALQRTRPVRNGYFVYFRRPPIYAGQGYGPEVGPYRFQSYEAVREITRLTNNGNVITRLGAW